MKAQLWFLQNKTGVCGFLGDALDKVSPTTMLATARWTSDT